MRKIFEFVDDNANKEILKHLDSLIFFDGEIWMFADGNRDFISKYIDGIMPLDEFIRLGNKISNNLNKMEITTSDYNPNHLIYYLNYES
jgi:hypothetical protein